MAGNKDSVTNMNIINEKKMYVIKRVTRLRKTYTTVYVWIFQYIQHITLGIKHNVFLSHQDFLDLIYEKKLLF